MTEHDMAAEVERLRGLLRKARDELRDVPAGPRCMRANPLGAEIDAALAGEPGAAPGEVVYTDPCRGDHVVVPYKPEGGEEE